MNVSQLSQLLAQKRASQTLVHCHGVFDPLHIGHIRHFQQAKKLGDLLVVTVTPDRFVNKGPHRPVFNEELRMEAIASLQCVDYVALNEWPMAVEAIQMLKPDVFVKGSEFRDRQDRTGAIPLEEEAVRAVGGRIEFTDDIVFSASNLVNRHLSVFVPKVREFLEGFSERWPILSILQLLEKVRPLRILVVGDAIIDDYQYCEAIGKSTKEATLVVKAQNAERFAGGALAVANHVAGFCNNVDLFSFLGAQNPQEEFIRSRLLAGVRPHLLMRQDAPTIVKRRFIEKYFFHKLFEVYEFNDEQLHPADDDAMCSALSEHLHEFDAVLAMDFGHGAISDRAMALLCERAKFLAVNTQTNAGNLGYHTLSRYPRADYLCVSETEIRLETRKRHGDVRPMMQYVADRLNCQKVMVTQGKSGALGYDRTEGFTEVPAFAGQIVDRVGGGDAFFSISAPCVALGASIEMAAFLGNAAGAQAIATVGHRSSLESQSFCRHVEHLLK